MNIELRHLRYFLAVAQELHFRKASEKLGIAQPALSQQIQQLERLVGYRLFVRTTRGVALTPEGALFAERARGTLAKVADDVAQVQRVGRGEEGVLTVGFTGSIIFTALPVVIEEFRRRYPRVELRLREMVTSAQIAALKAEEIDLGFLRDGDPTDGLAMTTLLRERYVAVLSERHPLAAKKTLQVEWMRDEPFLLFSPTVGSLAFERTMECCAGAGFRPRIVQEAPQWPTVVRLAAAGLGVSLAPECVASVKMPGAAYRSVHSPVRTTVDMAQRVGDTSALAANFAKIARERMAAPAVRPVTLSRVKSHTANA